MDNKKGIGLTALLVLCIGVAQAQDGSNQTTTNFISINTLWVLISAALVFFMQAGFKAFEVGLVRREHRNSIGIKNLIDWIVGSLAFFAIGYGFMFGKSDNGFIGTSMFLGDGIMGHGNNDSAGASLGIVFFLFQLAFAGTALTIISGAMSERTGFIPYLTGSAITAFLIYPIFGFWVWGDLFHADNEPWLATMGFRDFAGSTVVHSVGAWIALVGVWIVGPRLGRFGKDGKPRDFKANDYSYSVLGLIILWLGWWGFNGGSQLALDGDVGSIILNTNLAGAAAGLIAFYHSYLFQKKKGLYDKLLGGVLGGLVSITACCNAVTPMQAILIGAIAGIVHNLSYDLILNKFKLDDPVGAIPVHGFCGAFGTLCVGFFGNLETLGTGLTRGEQIGVQGIGVLVCFAFTTIAAFLMFKLLKSTVGLRVSPAEEKSGIIIGGNENAERTPLSEQEPNTPQVEEELSEEELLRMMMEAEEGEE